MPDPDPPVMEVMQTWSPTPVCVLRDPAIPLALRALYAILVSYTRPLDGRVNMWASLAELQRVTGLGHTALSDQLRKLQYDFHLIRRDRKRAGTTVTWLLDITSRYPSELGKATKDIQANSQSDHTSGQPVIPTTGNPVIPITARPDEEVDSKDEVDTTPVSDEHPSDGGSPSEEKHDRRPYFTTGMEIVKQWNELARINGLPPAIPGGGGICVRAAKTYFALEGTAWAGKSVTEIMVLIARELKYLHGIKLSFEMLFLSRAEPSNLARLLNGNWSNRPPQRDRGADKLLI